DDPMSGTVRVLPPAEAPSVGLRAGAAGQSTSERNGHKIPKSAHKVPKNPRSKFTCCSRCHCARDEGGRRFKSCHSGYPDSCPTVIFVSAFLGSQRAALVGQCA